MLNKYVTLYFCVDTVLHVHRLNTFLFFLGDLLAAKLFAV